MTHSPGPPDHVLADQIAYFEARAPEYDAGMEFDPTDPDFAEWRQVREKVREAGLTGDVLDLAAGTGLWTELLMDSAEAVTLVDAAEEALEFARRRLGDENVSYVVADLFDWKPHRRYDAIFSSFWLCHVPPDLVPSFVDLVESACRAGGSLLLVDEHDFEDPGLAAAAQQGEESWVSHRTAPDGREYRVVKVSHDPLQVSHLFQERGWRSSIGHHGDRFYVLTAQR